MRMTTVPERTAFTPSIPTVRESFTYGATSATERVGLSSKGGWMGLWISTEAGMITLTDSGI